MQIIIGILVTILGVLMVAKTKWFIQMLGRNPFAERTFGGGGTYIFYKLIGTVISIIGIVIFTGLTEEIFGTLFLNIFAR
jgi:hypothetical protein